MPLTMEIALGDLEGWRSGPSFLKLSETERPHFQDDDHSSHEERHQTLKEIGLQRGTSNLAREAKLPGKLMQSPFPKKRMSTISSATYCYDV